MTARRYGFFRVARHVYDRLLDDGEGVAIFTGFVPLRIQEDFRTGDLCYYGMHEQFRPIPLGEIAPEYTVSLTDGDAFPTWQEVPR